jgi:dienelactone hydrolase
MGENASMTRIRTHQKLNSQTTITLFLAMAAIIPGCSQLIDPNVPEPIHPCVEPQTGGEYLLYRPSSYDRKKSWPLIVACPSNFPDAPHKQIREWTQLAEQYGFLIAVPSIEFEKRGWGSEPTNLPDVLKKNERRILSTVKHVRAGHNISEDRVLLYGWKRGATFALYAGMRNPEVFRAIAVTRPDLQGDKLPGLWKGIDHHQPVQVHYDMDDFIKGKHNQSLIEWLRTIDASVTPRTIGEASKSDTASAILFFQDSIRKIPWLHIRAFTPNPAKPLEVHFKTKGSLSPKKFRWYFGDGDESVVAQPVHVFAKQGTYNVSVTVPGRGRGSSRGEIKRSATITVPGPQLRPGRE